jgi:hypothetical protein
MAVGLVLLGAVLKTLVSQNRTNAVQQEVAYAQQNVRAAMDLMVREIRNAGYNPEDGDFNAVESATEDSIRILSDVTIEDGNPDDPNEDVTYALNASNQLTRNGVRIVDFVSNLEFGYVLVDGTMLDPPTSPLTAAQREDLRAVIIGFGVRTENRGPDTGQYRYRNLINAVRIRNMGFQDIE